MTTAKNTPFVLVIRDGWGLNPYPDQNETNAVHLARTPVADSFSQNYPKTLIKTCGEDVGLTDKTMGNSEVGHQNIGAGRIVDQDAVRISKACKSGALRENAALVEAITGAARKGRAVHLMGICSNAGVHGQLAHLYALLDLCKNLEAERVFIHLFTDGRDTGPFSGKDFVGEVERECASRGVGRVVSLVGRYWAMDRDSRWERVRKAYDLLVGHGSVRCSDSAQNAMQAFYDNPPNEDMRGDEFVEPVAIGDDWRDTRISDGDAVIFYNYRGDRPRELSSAFLLPEFDGAEELKPSPDSGHRGFDRGQKLDLDFVLMTPYSERLAGLARVAFPRPPKLVNIAGEYFSNLGMTQFRCAETEKYPHVTFFFNDYREEPFPGEKREIVQSPRVATYDLAPEMSARGVCDAVLARLRADDCEDVIVVNFANADMVGHTGSIPATVRACEMVDTCVGEIFEQIRSLGGSMIVTADHGNAEQLWNPETDSPQTAHTIFDVPIYVVGEAFRGRSLRGDFDASGWFDPAVRDKRGRLADIIPTAIDMLGLDRPPEMTGRSLLV